jgi:hypothetical protein
MASAGKWVLEVLKRTLHTQQMAAEDCSKVAIEAGLKKKCMLGSRKRT